MASIGKDTTSTSNQPGARSRPDASGIAWDPNATCRWPATYGAGTSCSTIGRKLYPPAYDQYPTHLGDVAAPDLRDKGHWSPQPHADAKQALTNLPRCRSRHRIRGVAPLRIAAARAAPTAGQRRAQLQVATWDGRTPHLHVIAGDGCALTPDVSCTSPNGHEASFSLWNRASANLVVCRVAVLWISPWRSAGCLPPIRRPTHIIGTVSESASQIPSNRTRMARSQ